MYDSRSDRADWSGPQWETDKPWQLRERRDVNPHLKRQTAKRNRRIPVTCEMSPLAKRFSNHSNCGCCHGRA